MDTLIIILCSFLVGAFVGRIVGIMDYERDHGPGGYFYEKDRWKRGEYRDGIKHAADIIRSFNSSTTHEWDLGDCILAKFNLLETKKIRKNQRRLMVTKRRG